MPLPNRIPVGVRIVVRVSEGIDPADGRAKFRDYVGHVHSWDGHTLELTRDAAANGSRPAQHVTIDASTIARLKPVPERPQSGALTDGAVRPRHFDRVPARSLSFRPSEASGEIFCRQDKHATDKISRLRSLRSLRSK